MEKSAVSAAALRDPLALGAPLRFGPGRRAKPLRVAFDRELSVEDFLAASQSDIVQTFVPPRKLRERHHMLARVLAQGVLNQEAAIICGYDPQYVASLKSDPAFKELLAYYKQMEAEQYNVSRADMHEKLAALGHDSIAELHDRLEAEPEKFTNKELLAIAEVTADRTGFGKTSTVNHQHEHSISAETLDRIKRNALAPAVQPSAEDRESLLRLASRGTAPELSEAEKGEWIEGAGNLVREESDSLSEEEVAAREPAVPQVDQVPGSERTGARGA